MKVKVGTKEKIFNIAQSLFIERGYNNTSLRDITQKAEVNLAAVNYHFGDKNSLVQAILDHYLVHLMPEVHEQLVKLNIKASFSVEEVLTTVKAPLLSLNTLHPNGMHSFLLLIASGYSDVQGHLRWFIVNHYGKTLALFKQSMVKANPNIDEESLFWRLHFALGAFVFATVSSRALNEIASSKFEQDSDLLNIIEQAIPYISAGLETDNPQVNCETQQKD